MVKILKLKIFVSINRCHSREIGLKSNELNLHPLINFCESAPIAIITDYPIVCLFLLASAIQCQFWSFFPILGSFFKILLWMYS